MVWRVHVYEIVGGELHASIGGTEESHYEDI